MMKATKYSNGIFLGFVGASVLIFFQPLWAFALLVLSTLALFYKNFWLDSDSFVKYASEEARDVVGLAVHHINEVKEKTIMEAKQEIKDLLKEIPSLARSSGKAFAQGMDETIPLYTISESISRNKIGLAATMKSIYSATSATDIMCEGLKAFSMAGLEANCIEKFKSFAMRPPEIWKGDTEEALTDALPVALLATSMAGFEVNDVPISNLMDRTAKNITNTDKVAEKITALLKQVGLISDPNLELLTELATEADALKDEWAWMTNTLASNANDFCKEQERSRVTCFRERINKLGDSISLLGQTNAKLKTTTIWQQTNFMVQKSYDTLAQIDTIQKQAKSRIVPVGVCIYGGESQIGKSELAARLIQLVQEKLLARDDHHFSRVGQWGIWRPQVRDEFDTGYCGQEVTYQDDAFNGKDNLDHPKWINFISPSPIGTVQAQLLQKGCPYRSVLCMVSCNKLPETSITINNIHALHERFPITIRATSRGPVPKTSSIEKEFKHLKLELSTMSYWIQDSRVGNNAKEVTVDNIAEAIVQEMLRKEAFYEAKIREETLVRFAQQESAVEEDGQQPSTSEPETPPVKSEEGVQEQPASEKEVEKALLFERGKQLWSEVKATSSEWKSKTTQRYNDIQGKIEAKFSKKLPHPELAKEPLTEEEVLKLTAEIDVAVGKEIYHKRPDESSIRRKLGWSGWFGKKPRFTPIYSKELPPMVQFSKEDQLLLGKLSNYWATQLTADLNNARKMDPLVSTSQLEMWWKYLEMGGKPLTSDDLADMSIGTLILSLSKMKVIPGKEKEFNIFWAKQPIIRFLVRANEGQQVYFWGPRLWNGSKIFLDSEDTRRLIAKVVSYEMSLDEFEEDMFQYLRITGTIAALGLIYLNPFAAGITGFTMLIIALLRSPRWGFQDVWDRRGHLDWPNLSTNIIDFPMRFTSTVLKGLVDGISASLSLVAGVLVNAFVSVLQWFGYSFDITMETWLHSLGRKVIDVLAIGILALLLLLLVRLYFARKTEAVEESGRAGATRQGKVASRKGKIMPVRQEAEKAMSCEQYAKHGTVECEANEIGHELMSAAEELEEIDLSRGVEHHITFYWSKHYGWHKDEPDLKKDYNKMIWDGHISDPVPKNPGGVEPIRQNNTCRISSKPHFRANGQRGRSLVIELEVGGTEEEVTNYIEAKLDLIHKRLRFSDLTGVWESWTWVYDREGYWQVKLYCFSSLGVKEGDEQETYWTKSMLKSVPEVQRELSGVVVKATPAEVVLKASEEALSDIPRAGKIQRFLVNGNSKQWGLAHKDMVACNGHFGKVDDLVEVRKHPSEPTFTLGIVVEKHNVRDLMWIKLLTADQAAKRLQGRSNLRFLDIAGYSKMIAPDLTSSLVTEELLERSNGNVAIVKLPTTGITAQGKLNLVGRRSYHLETETVERNWFHITGFQLDGDDKLTQKGDCGGPVFLVNNTHNHAIMGMHAGSGNRILYGTILTVSDLPLTATQQSAEDVFEELICSGPPEDLPPGSAVEFVGRYNGDNLPMSGTKSPWKHTPWTPLFTEVLVPPPLLPTDERIEVELPKNLSGSPSLVMNQTKFLAEELPSMDQSILDYAEDAKVEELCSLITLKSVNEDRDVMIAEGLNGHVDNQCVKSLNIEASAGLPWTNVPNKVRKADHIERSPLGHLYLPKKSALRNRVNFVLDRAKQGERSVVLVGAKLKDQLIKIEHVKNGKVRVFHCVPVEKIVADAALFGHFKEGFLKLGLLAQHAIGINPHCVEWTAIAEHLLEHPNYFDLDFSQYDKRLHAQVMRTAFNIIRRVIQRKAPDDWDEARRVLGEMSIETLVVDYDTIYKTSRGNKSGEYLTTIINSIVNDLYSFYCWVKLTKKKDFYQFRVNVRTVSFGDDKIESVSDKFFEIYNYKNCEQVLKEIGHVITPGGKTGTSNVSSIDDLEFLKRRFVEHGRWFYAPLKKTSIESPFVWSSIPESEFEIWYGLVAENLYEASLWGREYYYEFRNKLRRGDNVKLVEHLAPLLNRKFEEVENAYETRYVTRESGIRDYEQFE